jgi:hypothetical protein
MGAVAKTVDLPELFTDSKLSWAVVVLSDSRMQSMLCDLLAQRLFDMGNTAVDTKSVLMNITSVVSVTLPHSDSMLRAMCQLCQMALRPFAYRLRAVDDSLLRVHFPALLHTLFSEQIQYKERVSKVMLKSTSVSAACGKVATELIQSIYTTNSLESEKVFNFLVSVASRMLQINFDKK